MKAAREWAGGRRRRTAIALLGIIGLGACQQDSTGPSSSDNSSTCTATTATTFTVGQVMTGLTGSSLCLAGGSSDADFALIAFNASSVPTGTASLTLQATGVTAPTSSILTNVFALHGASMSLASTALAGPRTRNVAFDARLRANERRVLTPRIAAARRDFAARHSAGGALRDVIPSSVTVGQLLRLNTNVDSACTLPTYSIGRVVAITNNAIIVADTANPTGGFTDAEYQSIGVSFDTLINPLDTRNFGQPTDIDGNGHVLIFFSRAVNALTAAGSDSYIGGFFYARDLFPIVATTDFDACPGSNYGEMFYIMVPDPTGAVNGNAFTKDFVSNGLLPTLAHEYQHLINGARRMYVNTQATDFEEVWLNEGLSHIAEELMFYAESGLQPRQDVSATTIRSSQAYINAYNSCASANLGRYGEFLRAPTINSPFAPNDSLATRGATWSFLRFAVDRQNTTDSNIWYQLVNSTVTGLDNLQNVFGTSLGTLFRDWSTAVIADGVSGVDPKYSQPSWDFRSIYDAVGGSYPLVTTSLASGTQLPESMDGGGAAYVRFTVAAGAAGYVQWGTLPSTVELTLVRTR